MTKKAAQDNEEKEVDQLLDFFENNQVSDFSQEPEIKLLLGNLKEKIEKMKQQDDWKEKEGERIRQARQARNEGQDDDKYSQFSGGHSEGKSVSS